MIYHECHKLLKTDTSNTILIFLIILGGKCIFLTEINGKFQYTSYITVNVFQSKLSSLCMMVWFEWIGRQNTNNPTYW